MPHQHGHRKETVDPGQVPQHHKQWQRRKKAESFGKWLMKVRIKYKFHRCDEDLYYFPKKPLTVYTMKELFEIYENEIHKHLVHK